MHRYRRVAAAPSRRASDTWDVIGQLVISTLEKSPHISGSDVSAAMEIASAAGRMLVAGGHLEKHAIVVVADPVYLSITTVSGVMATNLEEDLTPVPGGTTAREWTIYVPTPDPIGDAVRLAIMGSSHLSAEEPPNESTTKLASSENESVLNLDAITRREREPR